MARLRHHLISQCSVAAAVEPVAGSLSTAGLERADPGEGGEGRLAADPARV